MGESPEENVGLAAGDGPGPGSRVAGYLLEGPWPGRHGSGFPGAGRAAREAGRAENPRASAG